MVTFPNGFIQLKYPGYFWHPESEQVYSIKSGVLTPLAISKFRAERVGGRIKIIPCYNFCISVKGRRIRLRKQWLKLNRYTSNNQEIQINDRYQSSRKDAARGKDSSFDFSCGVH